MDSTRCIDHWSNGYLNWGADMLCKAKEILDKQTDLDETSEELGQAMLMGMDAIDEILRIREEQANKVKTLQEYLPF